MNRTKKELVKHAGKYGYTKDAIAKISGFLIGVGFKDESEQIFWKIGNGSWEEFIAWWNGRDIKMSIFETIMDDLFMLLDESKNETDRERHSKQIEWMCAKHIKFVDNSKKRD